MAYVPGDKIGEYIHYKYENYMRYGLARKLSLQSQPQQSLTKYIWEARQEASAFLAQKKVRQSLKKMELALNYLTGKYHGTGKFSPEYLNLVRQYMVDSLQSEIKGLSVADINWETMTLSSSGRDKIKGTNIDYDKMLSIIQQKTAGSKKREMLKLSTLKKQLVADKSGHNIQSFLRRVRNVSALVSSIGLGQQEEEELQRKIKNIVDKLELPANGKQSGRFQDSSLYEDLIKIVEEVIISYSIAGFEGLLSEYAVSTVGAIFAQQVGKTTKDLIEKGVVGSIKEKNIFIENSFMKGIDLNTVMGNSHYTKSNNGITWELKGTGVDGKIDSSIVLNETVLKNSVKSYDLQGGNPKIKGVSLVSGTNILFLLSNKARFLNHYLNQSVNTAPQSIIQQANEHMKLMILLLAFTGGGYRQNQQGEIYKNRADVFVINDKSKKHGMKVFSIYELYEKIILTPSLYSGIEINLDKNHAWNNEFCYVDETGVSKEIKILSSAKANQRISNILAQVNNKKIKASIGFKTMNNAMYSS